MKSICFNNPDDVEPRMSFTDVMFKANGKNTSEISWLEVHNMFSGKEYEYVDRFLLNGYKPGDGFIKNKSGIYAFVKFAYKGQYPSIKDRIIYIGKARFLRNRLFKHLIYSGQHIIDKIDENDEPDEMLFEIYVWYTEKPEDLERQLINEIKPKYNTHYIP